VEHHKDDAMPILPDTGCKHIAPATPSLSRHFYSSQITYITIMKKILIVDDHPSIRIAIKAHLENIIGVDAITEADNGQTAMELLRHDTFSLAMIDLVIPRINGLELISRIRAHDAAIRIIVFSGQEEAIYAGRAMQAGANGFISKKNDISHIIRAVEMVLSGFNCFREISSCSGHHGFLQKNDTTTRTLTNKELAILQHLAEGLSNKAISEKLFISNKTVSTHKIRIMEKINASTLVELIDYARKNNITSVSA
jgi:two-component system response regulator EvgA